jgi:hypothetical protein
MIRVGFAIYGLSKPIVGGIAGVAAYGGLMAFLPSISFFASSAPLIFGSSLIGGSIAASLGFKYTKTIGSAASFVSTFGVPLYVGSTLIYSRVAGKDTSKAIKKFQEDTTIGFRKGAEGTTFEFVVNPPSDGVRLFQDGIAGVVTTQALLVKAGISDGVVKPDKRLGKALRNPEILPDAFGEGALKVKENLNKVLQSLKKNVQSDEALAKPPATAPATPAATPPAATIAPQTTQTSPQPTATPIASTEQAAQINGARLASKIPSTEKRKDSSA